MLNLILGAAGTGKTTQLYARVAQSRAAGRRVMLLVPEQSSFETEKALYRRLGAQDALAVEVLSFTRLCDSVFREFGGMAGVYIDTPSKYLLMAVAIGEVADKLRLYQASSGVAPFVSSMCEIISEVKTAGVTPDTLLETAQQTDGLLAQKLSDIALIYAAYQTALERGYHDPDDDLPRALACVRGTDFFAPYDVYIDGFAAFMGAEWAMLGEIMRQCESLTAAFTCSSLDDHRSAGAFCAPAKTAMRLTALARECGRTVAPPVVLREPHRFGTPSLAYLAQNFGSYAWKTEEQRPDGGGITLTACDDVYDELEEIAREIVTLVREQNCRYRDIAVISRTLDAYLVPLQVVFSKYDIPYFMDMRSDVQVHPFVSGLLYALDAARTNFDTDSLIALSKLCITGIDPVDAGLLEDYCFTWSVRGHSWTRDFRDNPAGMQKDMTPEQNERLARINGARERLVAPVAALKSAISRCDGEGFAEALWNYLEQCGAAENLQQYADGMPPEQAKRFLEESAQVWDILVALFDAFAGVLQGYTMPSGRLIELFRLGISAAETGQIPQTLDQVLVGMADRIRPERSRAVFVAGLNEGEFPRYGAQSGILSGQERDRLHSCGIDLLRTLEQQMQLEQYYVYFALTQAHDRLHLSYPQRDAGGIALAPSSAALQVRQMFSLPLRYAQAGDDAAIVTPAAMLDRLSRRWNETDSGAASLRAAARRALPERLDALERCANPQPHAIHHKESARALFGEHLSLSPSRVDRYYSCPFLYFCADGLRLRARRRVDFSPLESGEMIHLVLEQLLVKYGGKGLSEVEDDVMQAEISEILEQGLRERVADLDARPARFRYLFRRLAGTLFRMIKRLALEFANSEFEPVAFEVQVKNGGDLKPLDLVAPDGSHVRVTGVIDRIDAYTRDQQTYIRVVDYKSGTKEFALSDVYYGLNMQMLIYLFAACEDGQYGEDATPAGVLYMPARDALIAAPRDASPEEIQQKQMKNLRMNGLLIADETALHAMEPGLGGVFLPVNLKKDGSLGGSKSLATLEEFGKLRRHVEHRLTEMAELLHDGRIEALPACRQGGTAPCAWCDYRAVCTREESDGMRQMADLDRERIFGMIESGEEDGANG